MRRLIASALVLLMITSLALNTSADEEPLGWATSAGGFEEDFIEDRSFWKTVT